MITEFLQHEQQDKKNNSMHLTLDSLIEEHRL